jgi:hypothetical protein
MIVHLKTNNLSLYLNHEYLIYFINALLYPYRVDGITQTYRHGYIYSLWSKVFGQMIFYYIFHIKPQFLKTLFQSQFLFDFDEIFTNRSYDYQRGGITVKLLATDVEGRTAVGYCYS